MASALQGVRLAARSCVYRSSIRIPCAITRGRPFSHTPVLAKRSHLHKIIDDLEGNADFPRETLEQMRQLDKENVQASNLYDEEDEENEEDEDWDAPMDVWDPDFDPRLSPKHDAAILAEDLPEFEEYKRRLKETYMNLGEDEPWEEEGMIEEDDDDMTALGHGELEKHREQRHFARLIAWEMPLLYKLAVPFQPPTAAQPLRFRYTTYMGEQHPAEKKVVVEFCVKDMPDLTEIQALKLKKLAGPRYDERKDIIKMSCERFETQMQNKRYLGDTIESLLKEARTGDMFEDVPLRLKKRKPHPRFPSGWVMTERRREQMLRYRQEVAARQEALQIEGVIDGLQEIAEGLKLREADMPVEEELVPVGKSKGGKRIGMKR